MSLGTRVVLWGAALTLLAVHAATAQADPGLELLLASDPNVPVGQPVTLELWMRGVLCDPNANRAAGFQAFLAFHTDRVAFVGGAYTVAPFGLPLLPIVDLGGVLDLAAGIDPAQGQSPACGDRLLATLTFTARESPTGCTDARFRSHSPPSCIADSAGQPMLPLRLWVMLPPSSPADFDNDCDVDFVDFTTFSGCMAGPDVTTPPPGCAPADFVKADLDHDGDVDVGDFAIFQTEYTGP